MFQQCKKENCIAVVMQLQVETNGRDLARTCSFVNVTPIKHFLQYIKSIAKAVINYDM